MTGSDFREGMRVGVPIVLSAAPFGALFGAVAVQNGQTIFEATLMSATVFAGASQLVGLELFGHRVQPWLIILSIFAVNFRHILYSAAMTRFILHFNGMQKFLTFFLLTDPQFAETVKRGESGRAVTFAWYMGLGTIIYVPWLVVTLIGALLGNLITDPKVIGLDVLLPVYFLGLVFGFRKRDNFLPVALTAAIGSILAYRYIGSPWHVSVGALAGVIVAALMPVKASAPATVEEA
ncbi:AzlC family ABC transporter permease [Gellertiella hungarica]|uniref:Putative branched-subunit amino acid permease n=1 Tax=Gellertiella hungarica TaxID=1572859 RepID=A0A7W6J2H5_9HYPH|nr:AzlC family ABC transporter permease [Gellertiella hungarica]MBB4063571.1 putative branched-subunit amino acid permease [Gellertiella hungarica]